MPVGIGTIMSPVVLCAAKVTPRSAERRGRLGCRVCSARHAQQPVLGLRAATGRELSERPQMGSARRASWMSDHGQTRQLRPRCLAALPRRGCLQLGRGRRGLLRGARTQAAAAHPRALTLGRERPAVCHCRPPRRVVAARAFPFARARPPCSGSIAGAHTRSSRPRRSRISIRFQTMSRWARRRRRPDMIPGQLPLQARLDARRHDLDGELMQITDGAGIAAAIDNVAAADVFSRYPPRASDWRADRDLGGHRHARAPGPGRSSSATLHSQHFAAWRAYRHAPRRRPILVRCRRRVPPATRPRA